MNVIIVHPTSTSEQALSNRDQIPRVGDMIEIFGLLLTVKTALWNNNLTQVTIIVD